MGWGSQRELIVKTELIVGVNSSGPSTAMFPWWHDSGWAPARADFSPMRAAVAFKMVGRATG